MSGNRVLRRRDAVGLFDSDLLEQAGTIKKAAPDVQEKISPPSGSSSLVPSSASGSMKVSPASCRVSPVSPIPPSTSTSTLPTASVAPMKKHIHFAGITRRLSVGSEERKEEPKTKTVKSILSSVHTNNNASASVTVTSTSSYLALHPPTPPQPQPQPLPQLQLQPMTFGSTTLSSSSRPSGGASGFGSTGTSLFSSAKPTTGGGLFGSTTTNAQQQQQQQQNTNQQQQVIQAYHPFVRACGNPQLTGTDNDKHIANLNQVAAALGVGKAPYKDGNQVQTYNMEGNFFEKFVGIGYNKISEHTDDEGIVSIALKHPIADLNTPEKKPKILEIITNILGNQQNVKVLYAPNTTLRSLPDGCTEICIIVKEGGFVVGACKLSQVLNDAPKAAQLEAQLKADKTRIVPKVGMSKSQKERYLETVPDGIDERLWRQAIAENPAPSKILPVAVRGWEALRDRQKAQVVETKIYQDALASLANRVEKTESDHARAQIEMEAIRCRHKQLSYRLLRILLAQWISQRFSKQIDTDEDQIEARCDTLLAKINRQNQLQSWIANFYETLEKKGDKLREGAEKAYDMTEADQNYAKSFLTEILYIGERLVETNQLQLEDLQMIKRTLEGE